MVKFATKNRGVRKGNIKATIEPVLEGSEHAYIWPIL
jgi:hypothetical protein